MQQRVPGSDPRSSQESAAKIEFGRLYRQGGVFFSATQLTRTPILVTDPNRSGDPILFANAAFLAYFGYTESDVVGHQIEDLCDEDSCRVVAELRRVLAESHERPFDIALRRKDGSLTWTSVFMSSIADKEGRPAHHFLSFIDRSELAVADANVRALLIENARLVRELTQRDLLVAETNHRVKNALMQASMVLLMQGSRSENPEVADALNFARTRLEAMAGIYDLLSIKDATAIDIGAFLGALAPHLVPPLMPVVVETRLAAGILLPPDIAQPIALIAVELVTNAVKHAFPLGRDGCVRVELARYDDRVELIISDDGVGMPAGQKDSLGYQLVRGLVRQVGGVLEIAAGMGTGTAVRISVPLDPGFAAAP